MKKYVITLVLTSFTVSGMVTNSMELGRKRSRSKTISLIDNDSISLKKLDETKSAKSYAEHLDDLRCGIEEQNIEKIDTALKYWISVPDLDKALELSIQSSEIYDKTTKLILEKLLNKGANPNTQKGRVYSSLAVEAVKYRDVDLLKLLLKFRLNPNTSDEHGTRLLQMVEEQNSDCWQTLLVTSNKKYNQMAMYKILIKQNQKDLEIMDLLRQHGAYNKVGDTLLTEAVKNSEKFAIQVLLDKKFDINSSAENGLTSLMLAAFEGNFDFVKDLVKAGANINLKNQDGKTALMIAAENHWVDIVQYLIESGADINMRSNNGETVFGIALSHGYQDIAIILLNAMNNSISLTDEITYGQESVVDWYLQQKGIDINIKGQGGITPLMIAAENGNADIVKYLLASKADINAKNNDGDSALSIALSKGNNNIVDLLLSVGAEVSKQAKFSLIDAAKEGHLNIVKYCIGNGSEVDEKGAVGITPLMIASRHGHAEIVKYLLKNGADFSLKEDYRKYNALMFAAENGRKNIIKILLNHVKLKAKNKNLNGFDKNLLSKVAVSSYVNARDKFENNSLMIAVNQGHIHQNHREIIKMLINAGANVNCENKFRETPISIAERHHIEAKGLGKIKWSKIIKFLTK